MVMIVLYSDGSAHVAIAYRQGRKIQFLSKIMNHGVYNNGHAHENGSNVHHGDGILLRMVSTGMAHIVVIVIAVTLQFYVDADNDDDVMAVIVA
jgi:hypothetical protein